MNAVCGGSGELIVMPLAGEKIAQYRAVCGAIVETYTDGILVRPRVRLRRDLRGIIMHKKRRVTKKLFYIWDAVSVTRSHLGARFDAPYECWRDAGNGRWWLPCVVVRGNGGHS